jgi:hypothetical protein
MADKSWKDRLKVENVDSERTANAPSLWEALTGKKKSGKSSSETVGEKEPLQKPIFEMYPPPMSSKVDEKVNADTLNSSPSDAGGDGAALNIPAVGEIESILKRMKELEGERKLAPGDETSSGKQYNVEVENLKSAVDKARKEYEEKGTRADWAEVAETIGRGLVKIGTAQTGMKQGIDVSGFKYGEPTDWEKSRDRYGKEMIQEMSSAEKKFGAFEKKKEAEERERTKAYDDRMKALEDQYRIAYDKQRLAEEQARNRAELAGKTDPFALAKFKSELDIKEAEAKEARQQLGAIKSLSSLYDKKAASSGAAKKLVDKEIADFLGTKPPLPAGMVTDLDAIEDDRTSFFGGISDEEATKKRREVLGKYLGTGASSQLESNATGKFPRDVFNSKTNQKATVNNEAELSQAKAKGFN